MSENAFLVEMGIRIADRRRELHMTQETLAEKMGLSIQSVSSIELGKKRIRPENLSNLARTLDVSADYLLTGIRSKPQLTEMERSLSILDSEDYRIVQALIEHLAKKKRQSK